MIVICACHGPRMRATQYPLRSVSAEEQRQGERDQMSIKVGDRLPETKFRVMTPEGPAWKSTSVSR